MEWHLVQSPSLSWLEIAKPKIVNINLKTEKKRRKKNWEKSKVNQVQPKKTTRDRDEIGPTVNGWVLTAGAREHLVISTPFSIASRLSSRCGRHELLLLLLLQFEIYGSKEGSATFYLNRHFFSQLFFNFFLWIISVLTIGSRLSGTYYHLRLSSLLLSRDWSGPSVVTAALSS